MHLNDVDMIEEVSKDFIYLFFYSCVDCIF